MPDPKYLNSLQHQLDGFCELTGTGLSDVALLVSETEKASEQVAQTSGGDSRAVARLLAAVLLLARASFNMSLDNIAECALVQLEGWEDYTITVPV